MRALSEYLSAIILLTAVVAGFSILNYSLMRHVESIASVSKELSDTPKVSFIAYDNGYVYAYNYGAPLTVKDTIVEVYVNGTWIQTSKIGRETIFRVKSNGPYVVLDTNYGLLVIRP